MSDFLRFLLNPLLLKPEALEITEHSGQVRIKVDGEDMGRVIGKSGTIINALRNLARVFCATHNLPLVMVQLEESGA